jgi:uncharacterized spore protein YtfJ
VNVPEVLKIIGEQIQGCASGKVAYAEPVSVGDRMVIPVAWVRYDFGGGGESPGGNARMANQGGGGGGGQVSVVPAGIVEITPAGTRFIPIPEARRIFDLVASSFGSSTAMNYTSAPNTGNKTAPGTKMPSNKEALARRGGNRATANKTATKGSIPLAKKAGAKKAASAATKKSAAKRR